VKTKIRELRSRLKLTQQELADRVSVRRETIVFLEQGKYMPSLRLAYDVAQVFGEPIENVFMLDEGENQ
jgi:putative transcriptional regulator